MPWFRKYFLQDKHDDGKGGGGGGGKTDPPADDKDKLIADLKSKNEAFEARLAKLEGTVGGGGKTDPPADDKDLAEKARLEREAKEKSAGDTKNLETALKFNLGARDWLKAHASVLPKTLEGIFDAADKEKYDSSIEKASAVKVGIVSEFFAIQANLDLLTPTMKSVLEDFQKLTKNGKQERVQQIYDTVFEPAFEMLKRVEKAKQLNNGHGSPTDVEAAYKKRLMDGSRKHYLGERHNA